MVYFMDGSNLSVKRASGAVVYTQGKSWIVFRTDVYAIFTVATTSRSSLQGEANIYQFWYPCFGVVWSNILFQWSEDRWKTLQECQRGVGVFGQTGSLAVMSWLVFPIKETPHENSGSPNLSLEWGSGSYFLRPSSTMVRRDWGTEHPRRVNGRQTLFVVNIGNGKRKNWVLKFWI